MSFCLALSSSLSLALGQKQGGGDSHGAALLHLGSGTTSPPSMAKPQPASGHHSWVMITQSPLPICKGEGSGSLVVGHEWVQPQLYKHHSKGGLAQVGTVETDEVGM